jgi:hypothetical protein
MRARCPPYQSHRVAWLSENHCTGTSRHRGLVQCNSNALSGAGPDAQEKHIDCIFRGPRHSSPVRTHRVSAYTVPSSQ